MTGIDRPIGTAHVEETYRRWKVVEARAKMASGALESPSVVEATVEILRRTLEGLRESESRLPYQGRSEILQGPDDERDQT